MSSSKILLRKLEFQIENEYFLQCQAKYCELPVECKACGLTLVSAPHLARSYHHLFPLPAFDEVSLSLFCNVFSARNELFWYVISDQK